MNDKEKNIIKQMIRHILVFILIIGYKIYKICFPSVQKAGKGNIKVACIGDSITYGLGVEFKRKFSTYPIILAKLLGKKYQILNYGASSRTLLSSGNHPYIKTKFIEKSLKQNPNIIIIMLGSNDSKLINWDPIEYKKEYLKLVRKYQKLESNPKIYIMMPPKAFTVVKNVRSIRNNVIKNQICPIINEIGRETGVSIIDLYKITENHPEWFFDGIHPNKKGNKEIANYIANIIKPTK